MAMASGNRREIAVGALTLIGVVLFFFGTLLLKGGDFGTGQSWTVVFANVNGTIPSLAIKEAFPANDYQRHGITALYLAAQLQTANNGPVKFKLDGGPVAAVWIDGKPQASGTEVSAELASGTHTIVVRVDPKKLPDSLRLESSAGTFATN
jgi:hypothetical protein